MRTSLEQFVSLKLKKKKEENTLLYLFLHFFSKSVITSTSSGFFFNFALEYGNNNRIQTTLCK